MQTCKQQVPRVEKNPKSGTICLPMLYKLCSDSSKKWVLAFFQTDISKVSVRIWKWRVADPKMLGKVASG